MPRTPTNTSGKEPKWEGSLDLAETAEINFDLNSEISLDMNNLCNTVKLKQAESRSTCSKCEEFCSEIYWQPDSFGTCLKKQESGGDTDKNGLATSVATSGKGARPKESRKNQSSKATDDPSR